MAVVCVPFVDKEGGIENNSLFEDKDTSVCDSFEAYTGVCILVKFLPSFCV